MTGAIMEIEKATKRKRYLFWVILGALDYVKRVP